MHSMILADLLYCQKEWLGYIRFGKIANSLLHIVNLWLKTAKKEEARGYEN